MAKYAEVAELRDEVNLKTSINDTGLDRLLVAASEAIDRICNRPDGFVAPETATARVFAGKGRPYLYIDECVAVTAVAVKNTATAAAYTAWAPGDWITATGDHRRPDYNSTPYLLLICEPTGGHAAFTSGRYSKTQVLPTVQATARWGYAGVVPPLINQAAIMQATRWFKRLQGAMGDTLGSFGLGRLAYMQEVDPDIALILKRGRLIVPAVG